jgi:hypothetical protein
MKQLDELNPMPRWAMITLAGLIVVFGAVAFLYVQFYGPDKTAVIVPPVKTPFIAASAKPAEIETTGETAFGPFQYTHTRRGNTVVALFYKNFLPRDDMIFLGASDHVIKTAFGEQTIGSGSMMDYGNIKAIKMKSKNHTFAIVPFKEDTGEIHSLKIDCVDC